MTQEPACGYCHSSLGMRGGCLPGNATAAGDGSCPSDNMQWVHHDDECYRVTGKLPEDVEVRRSGLMRFGVAPPSAVGMKRGAARLGLGWVWKQTRQDWSSKCLLGGTTRPLAACGAATLCCSPPPPLSLPFQQPVVVGEQHNVTLSLSEDGTCYLGSCAFSVLAVQLHAGRVVNLAASLAVWPAHAGVTAFLSHRHVPTREMHDGAAMRMDKLPLLDPPLGDHEAGYTLAAGVCQVCARTPNPNPNPDRSFEVWLPRGTRSSLRIQPI